LSALGFEWRVAVRFLTEGRFQSLLIIVGVAAGVAVVAYISALITGLQRNTLEKTLGAQAHVSVSPLDERVTPALPPQAGTVRWSDTQARAQRLQTITNWQAIATLLAQRGEATRAIALSGVELSRYDRIVNLRSKLVAGTLTLSPGEAIIGQTLAEDLGVRVGDRITVVINERRDTVRLTGLVDLGIKDLNRRMVLVPLRSAQTLLNLPGGVTQIDLRLDDVWTAQDLAKVLARELPNKVESWQEANAQLVSALRAQSVSTAVIRTVVMLVVVLGIASVLVVSVVQKQREIGILRAMGTTRGQILRVFLLQGVLVATLGSLLGVLLAAGLIAGFTAFVKGSDGLPLFSITLPPAMALQIVLITSVAGVLAAVAPARRAAHMDPAQAIRM